MKDGKTCLEPPDGGYGWIIVAANIICNACLTVLVQCFGIIFQNDFQAMEITAAQTSFLLHLQNSLFCLLSLLSSPFLKRYSYKKMATVGSVLMTTGIFFTAFANNYSALLFTVSILIGSGQGILMPALYLATNTYFKKRLTLAVTFGVTGGSVSLIFMPQICNLLLNQYGTKYTILILFAIALHAFPCCLLLRPLKLRRIDKSIKDVNEKPEGSEKLLEENQNADLSKTINKRDNDQNGTSNEIELTAINNQEKVSVTLLNEEVYKRTTVPRLRDGILSKLISIFDLELLTQKPYLLIIIGMGVSFVSELNIVLMVPFVLGELSSFNREEIANFQSVHYTADFVGRLAIPLLAHRAGFSPKLMYALSLIGSSVGRLGLTIFSDVRPLLIYGVSVILGLAKGAKAVFQSLIIPKYVTLEKLPAATGLSMVLNGLLSLVIGPIIGLIHDLSNSYVYALHTASLLSLSCVFLWYIEALLKKKSAQNNTPPSA